MDDIIQLFAIGISRTQRKTKLSNMTLSYNVPSTSTWCHLGGSYKLSLECVCNFLLTEGRDFFIYIFLLLPTYKNSSIPLHVWWYTWESRGGYPMHGLFTAIHSSTVQTIEQVGAKIYGKRRSLIQTHVP